MKRWAKTTLATLAVGITAFGGVIGKGAYDHWDLLKGLRFPNPWKKQVVEQETVPGWTPHNLYQTLPLYENYAEHSVVWLLEERPTYTAQTISFHANGVSDRGHIIYYRNTTLGNTPRPLVFVHTMLEGFTEAEHLLMERYVNEGMDAASIIKPDLTPFFDNLDYTNITQETIEESIQQLNEFIVESLNRTRRGINIMLQQENVDANCTCSIGISLGGFINVVVAATDQRIKYNAIALAGSLDKTIAFRGKEGPIRRFGMLGDVYAGGFDMFIERVNQVVRFQPQFYAAGLNPANVKFYLSRNDDVVPYDAGIELIRLAGNAGHVIFFNTHKGTWANTIQLHDSSIDFFRERFLADPDCRQYVNGEQEHTFHITRLIGAIRDVTQDMLPDKINTLIEDFNGHF